MPQGFSPPTPRRRARALTRAVAEALERRVLLSNVIPVGPEFLIDGGGGPSVAMHADGGYIVAWHQESEFHFGGIRSQRFDAAGVPQGQEVTVTEVNGTGRLSVAMDADGDFVVAWSTWAGFWPPFPLDVHARLFSAAGTPQGDAFQVNTITGGRSRPSAAMDPDGNFVIAWGRPGTAQGFDSGVEARRFDAAGAAQGDAWLVDELGGLPAVTAMDAKGNFVIAWVHHMYAGAAQRYTAVGVPQGAAIPLGFFPNALAMAPDGRFVIVGNKSDGSGAGVYAQRFSPAGAPQADAFRVNTYTTNNQLEPSVAMDANGDFVIAWNSWAQDGSDYGIYAQRYTAAGVPQGGEFRVNTYTTNSQIFPSVAMDADGDFVIAWQSSGQDGSGSGVYAQRYAVVPEVDASEFHFATGPHALSFAFSRDVAASLGTDDLILQNLTTGQTIPLSDLVLSYDGQMNLATFSYTGVSPDGLAGVLPDGNYRATLLASGITTPAGAPLGEDHEFDFFYLNGDANRDGVVNLRDFNILAANFGQGGRDFTQGDFTYDGVVNLEDFSILAGRFGIALPAAGATSRALASFSDDRIAEEEDSMEELLV